MACEIKKNDDTEFIKPFFIDIKDMIKIEKIKNVPTKYEKKKMRLTLDYEEDFIFFKNVIEHFVENHQEMSFKD